jgi:hypothetical protein
MLSIFSVAIGSFIRLWVGMVVLCSPILVSANCRRLFDSGPSEYLVVNYLTDMGVSTFGHVALIFAGALVNYVIEVDIGVWFLGVTILYVATG